MHLKVFDKLASYHPVLCGTIPIEIDIETSDLDIICYYQDLEQFTKDMEANFLKEPSFSISKKIKRNHMVVIARFESASFLVEVFGQNLPIEEQMAYRHMLIEARILQEKGDQFRKRIIELKKSGMKTEPAFAKLLGLKGDPYFALLQLE